MLLPVMAMAMLLAGACASFIGYHCDGLRRRKFLTRLMAIKLDEGGILVLPVGDEQQF